MINLLDKIGKGEANIGAQMEVTGFDGESLSEVQEECPFITVLGRDSDKFREAKHEIQTEMMEKRGDDEDYKEPSGASQERRARLVGACVVGWKNINDGNTVLECTPEHVALLLDESPELVDQVDKFLSDRDNYLKKS